MIAFRKKKVETLQPELVEEISETKNILSTLLSEMEDLSSELQQRVGEIKTPKRVKQAH